MMRIGNISSKGATLPVMLRAEVTNRCSHQRERRTQQHGGRALSPPSRAALVLTTACTTTGGQARNPTSAEATTEASAGQDAATRDDADFNRQFRHQTAGVDGVKMHYVISGTGEPLVLLHGWPQSWYAWRGIMPALAEKYTVYALDLPGLGDSVGAPSGYDKATLARYVHGLLADNLGLRKINLVGHEMGAGVGFQYAAQFPGEVVEYAHLDYPLPGPALSAKTYRQASWHMSFHSQNGFPEMLVDDDVRDYLSLFYGYVAYGGTSFGEPGAKAPFTEQQIDEYARTYRRPQVLAGGFELYRTLDQDERTTRPRSRSQCRPC
jgi:pimeloyl-ACP methyl ester carboxylesterase